MAMMYRDILGPTGAPVHRQSCNETVITPPPGAKGPVRRDRWWTPDGLDNKLGAMQTRDPNPWRRRTALSVLLVLLPSLVISAFADPGASQGPAKIRLDRLGKKGVKSITRKELMKYVSHLASDEMQGREAGTDKGYEAGEYVASEFERLGLKPGGDKKTYYQTFNMGGEISRASLDESNRVDVTHRRKPKKGDDDRTFKYRYDFIPLSISASMMVDPSPVTFVGYGLSEKDKGYDDYRGKKVKGSVVVALDHVPREGKPDGPFQGEEAKYSDPLHKAKTAEEKGALGLILIKDILNHPGVVGVPKDLLGGWPPPEDVEPTLIPVIYASQEMATFILGGKDPGKLQKKIDSKGKPASSSIKSRFASLRVASFGKVSGAGRNIIGVHPGVDEKLKEEVVVIGAHYDHVGLGSRGREVGQVHNGANDNASGTSGLLEVAEAFAEMKIPVRRSIIFIAFDGEEKGLLGSKYYVTAPTFPLEKTVAMLNMDMIGVNPKFEVFVGAGRENRALEEIHVAASKIIGLSLRYDQMDQFRNRNDSASFLEKGVPALFFFTGMHPEYHRPSDDIGLINPSLHAGVARLCFITALVIANRDTRP